MSSTKLGMFVSILLLLSAVDARLGGHSSRPTRRQLGRKNCSGSSMLGKMENENDDSDKYKICLSSNTTTCFQVNSSGNVKLETYVSGDSAFEFGFADKSFEYTDEGNYLDRVNIWSFGKSVKLEAKDFAETDGVQKFKITVKSGNSCSLSKNLKISYYDGDPFVNENKYLRKDGTDFEWKSDSGDGTTWKIEAI